MSSKVQTTVPVNMVRIQWSSDKQWDTYKKNVTVVKTTNAKNGQITLRILNDNKSVFNENIDDLQWLHDSSAPGVAVIGSDDVKIIISYNLDKNDSVKFFNEIEEHLGGGPTPQPPVEPPSPKLQVKRPSPPSPPPEPSSPELDADQAIDQLLKSIRDGDSRKAELAAKTLGRDRSDIGFNLVSQTASKDTQSKSKSGASSNVLELKVQVECHLDRNPVVETIYVPTGTKLKTLKIQIEQSTGIHPRDQYWYAFGKYLIPDNYEFGSDKPVVPPRSSNAPKRQEKLPTDPIRSRDTVIMYIAKLAPCQA